MHFVIYEHTFPTDFYVILIVGATIAADAPVAFVDCDGADNGGGSVAAANVVRAAAADTDGQRQSSFRIFTIIFLSINFSFIHLFLYFFCFFVSVRTTVFYLIRFHNIVNTLLLDFPLN